MSTPHFHALIHLVNLYQHETLATIAQAIEKKWLDPVSVVRFSQWIHAEEPPDAQQCERERAVVEQAWGRRFDDGKHESLCVLPKSVVESRARNSWTSPELTEADTAREADIYRRQYDVDAQFVCSRVQEHVASADQNRREAVSHVLKQEMQNKMQAWLSKTNSRALVRCVPREPSALAGSNIRTAEQHRLHFRKAQH